MSTTALYRKNGGECIKISLKGQTFDLVDPTYWGVLTDLGLLGGISSCLNMNWP